MKTPAERGPFATWVVETRNALDLTAEQIAAATGYNDATIRKLEGGTVTRPQRRKVTEYLLRVAAEQGMRVAPPPVEGAEPSPVGDFSEVVAAIREQAAAMRELVAALAEDQDRQQGRMDGLANVIGELVGTLESLRPVLAGRHRKSE